MMAEPSLVAATHSESMKGLNVSNPLIGTRAEWTEIRAACSISLLSRKMDVSLAGT
jgi:hypothetical protein